MADPKSIAEGLTTSQSTPRAGCHCQVVVKRCEGGQLLVSAPVHGLTGNGKLFKWSMSAALISQHHINLHGLFVFMGLVVTAALTAEI